MTFADSQLGKSRLVAPSGLAPQASFYSILKARARQSPHQIAFEFFGDDSDATEIWHYRDLLDQVRALAITMQPFARIGQRVLISLPGSSEFVRAFLACQAIGAIAVPVPTPTRNKTDHRLLQICRDCQPSLLLTNEAFAQALTDYEPALLANLPILSMDKLPLENTVVALDEADIAPDTVACLQYTSGSTGKPKGVVISHHNLLHNSALIYQQTVGHGLRLGMSWLPQFHDMGLVGGILQPLFAGYPVLIMAPVMFLKRPMSWLRRLSERSVNITAAPNFALQLCAQRATDADVADLDLSALSVLLCGAEPVQAKTIELFNRRFADSGFNPKALTPAYGLAEATLMVSAKPAKDTVQVRRFHADSVNEVGAFVRRLNDGGSALVSCGPQVQSVEIVHPTTRQALPAGQVGEIWVGSDSVASGYWQQPQLNEQLFGQTLPQTGAAKIPAKRFMRTGDLGFFEQDELFVTGRIKDLLIIRGKNFHPHDIESIASRSHASLAPGKAVAFSADVAGSEQLVVLVETSRQGLRACAQSNHADQIVAGIRQSLVEDLELNPAVIYLLRPMQLLMTSSGKIQRQANRRAWLSQQYKVVHQWQRQNEPPVAIEKRQDNEILANRDDIERWIVAGLASRCGLPHQDIKLDQPFASFGLDSLGAVEMVAQLEQRLRPARSIEPTALWNYPTVNKLLEFLCLGPDEQAMDAAPRPVLTTRLTTFVSNADDEISRLRALLDSH